MTPEKMQALIHDATRAVYAMDDKTLLSGLNAGLLDRRFEWMIGRDRSLDPPKYRCHKRTIIKRKRKSYDS